MKPFADAALVFGQHADRERVDGDVLRRAERVVQEDDRREQARAAPTKSTRIAASSVAIMPTCISEDPGAAPAEALRRERVDERADRPLERPRQVERADEGADRGRAEAAAAHLRGDRRRREAERDALGDVEEEEGGEAPLAGREQVRQGDAHGRRHASTRRRGVSRFALEGATTGCTHETDKLPETRRSRRRDDREGPKATAADFHPEVLRLFDRYVHGRIDRRGFLEGAAKFAVRGVTAAALLEALSPDFADAEQVAKTDPRIGAETVEFPSPQGYGTAAATWCGRRARRRPAARRRRRAACPAVLVVHENRGLNPHIEDIARRLALDNFIAFAPDALFPLGGYPGDEDKARELFASSTRRRRARTWSPRRDYLKGVPGGNGKLGAVGFCWGGGMVNMLATRLPDLAAAVPFYGQAPATERCRIQAPLLLIFADNDDNVNSTWPAYEAALKAAGKRYEALAIRARSTASTTTRPRATTQRRGTGLAAHARLPQPEFARLSDRIDAGFAHAPAFAPRIRATREPIAARSRTHPAAARSSPKPPSRPRPCAALRACDEKLGDAAGDEPRAENRRDPLGCTKMATDRLRSAFRSATQSTANQRIRRRWSGTEPAAD